MARDDFVEHNINYSPNRLLTILYYISLINFYYILPNLKLKKIEFIKLVYSNQIL